MFFNSLQFLVFFPVVCALYFATPNRFRWVLLLAASYYFYMSWRPEGGRSNLIGTFPALGVPTSLAPVLGACDSPPPPSRTVAD